MINPVAQMTPGMEFIPLIVIAVIALGVALVVGIAIRLLRWRIPDRKFGGTIAILSLSVLAILFLNLHTPVSENRVLDVAKPGITIAEMVSQIGEPHEKHMNDDGSGTFHYYADYIGRTGIGVIVNSDGTIDDAWVD